jgi:hypothetical protein
MTRHTQPGAGPAIDPDEDRDIPVVPIIALAGLAVCGAVAFGAPMAGTWIRNQAAAQQRVLACQAELRRHPPCNTTWTRTCARRCHSRYSS